jgi:hypothetical protein
MALVDLAPFFVVLFIGAAAGRLLPGRVAWPGALLLPVGHFILSIATGRAREGFLSYVVPINLVLLALAVVGMLGGRWLRGPRSER